MEHEMDRLLQLLVDSMSNDTIIQSNAEVQLKEIQKTIHSSTFIFHFLHIITMQRSEKNEFIHPKKSIDDHIRLIAIIWLKNSLFKSWKNISKGYERQEKYQLYQCLLFATIHESNSLIAIQLSLIIASIARADFPTQWSMEDLFGTLFQALNGNIISTTNTNVQLRTCFILHRVLKELSTRRLMIHRKQFSAMAIEILPMILQYWGQIVRECCEQMHLDTLQMDIEQWTIVLTMTKILSSLVITSFRELVSNETLIQLIFQQIYEQLQTLLQIHLVVGTRNSMDLGNHIESLEKMKKSTFRMADIIVNVQKTYPIEFRASLTPFMMLFWSLIESPSSYYHTRMYISALQFFTNVLGCTLYQKETNLGKKNVAIDVTKVITAAGDVVLNDEMVNEAATQVKTFLFTEMPVSTIAFPVIDQSSSVSRINYMIQLVVLKYMRLTHQDLEDWQEDAEHYVTKCETLTAQESIRACGEHLFLTILSTYPQATISILTQLTNLASSYLHEIVSSPQDNIVPEDRILDIDAVLLALGLGCYDLHECFDFEQWFHSTLVPVLLKSHVNSNTGSVSGVPVLHYRISWLISCWLAQISAETRPHLYQALLSTWGNEYPSTTKSNIDIALQLRSIQTLEAMINDWNFESKAFEPYLSRTIAILYGVFEEIQDREWKVKILGTVEIIARASGPVTLTILEQLIYPLESFWGQSNSETEQGNGEWSLIRCKILQLINALVQCVQEYQSNENNSADGENEGKTAELPVNFIIMCWRVVELATNKTNPDTIYLMEPALELYQNILININDGYSESMHQLYRNVLEAVENDYEHIMAVLQITQEYIRLGSNHFWGQYHEAIVLLFQQLLGNVKVQVAGLIGQTLEIIIRTFKSDEILCCLKVFHYMITSCIAIDQKLDTMEPSEIVFNTYLSVLATLVLYHQETAILDVMGNNSQAIRAVVSCLLDRIFTLSHHSSFYRRKTYGIALCFMMKISVVDFRMDVIGRIIDACAEILEDEKKENIKDEKSQDDTNWKNHGVYRSYSQAKKTNNDKRVMETDLKVCVQAQLELIANTIGYDQFHQLIATIDTSALQVFQS